MATSNAMLEALIAIQPNINQNKKTLTSIQQEVNKALKEFTVGINTNQAIKQVKNIKVEADAVKKTLKSLSMDVETITGQMLKVSGTFSNNGKFSVKGMDSATNIDKITSAYKDEVKQLSILQQKRSDINNNPIGTKEESEYITQLDNKIKSLTSSLESSKKQLQSYGSVQLSQMDNTSKLSKAENAYGQSVQGVGNTLQTYSTTQKEMLSLQKQLYNEETTAKSGITQNTSERKKYISMLKQEISTRKQILTTIEKENISNKAVSPQLQDIRSKTIKDLKLYQAQLDSSKSANKGFFNDMMTGWKDAAARIVNYTIVYRSLWAVIKGFQAGVATIAELNKSFVDIQMVTGDTDAQIQQLSKDYGTLAIKMGSTINDVALGATEWIRQGKSVKETGELLKQSMILSKTSTMEADEATSALTSTLNGYKMSVKDASMVVDVFNKLDTISATSAKELAIAFSKTANSAHDWNMLYFVNIAYHSPL